MSSTKVRTTKRPDSLPVGTLTFLMTDIEGSTKVWNVAPKAAARAIAVHDRWITQAVQENNGHVVESGREGDSVLAVFTQASEAVSCAVSIQSGLRQQEWPAGIDVRVRIAIHTGDAELRSGHYVGPPLYRCARLMATAHGGQVLVSKATEELVADNLPEGGALKDLGIHRLRDLSRTEHVYQLEHAELPAEFPSLKSLDEVRTNLPEKLTTFVGRHADVAALRHQIRETRLVTLHGAGGIGKSRLAIELARDSFRQWPDGVWWVDLAPVSDPQMVPSAIAGALRAQGAGPASETAISWLSPKRTLLILDNCEHLVEACAEFCRTGLERCPELVIVATSREPLGIAGELRWPMSPLPAADALSLFEQRARLVQPDFKVTTENREVIAELCARLDDLPLAIELAAARLGAMTVRQIAKQLADRFKLLSMTRHADPRHQTMTAAIDWSYRLLSEDERTLFERLSVFSGGFTVESAQAVCSDETMPDTLPSLTGLVEKSMVAIERLADGDARYRLLESQHEYASDKLRADGAEDALRGRHYDYFCEALTTRTAGIAGPMAEIPAGPAEARWLRPERANIWSAAAWGRIHRADLGLPLAARVGMSAAAMSVLQVSELRRWLADLIEQAPPDLPELLTAMSAACVLGDLQGDYSECLRLARRAIDFVKPDSSPRWKEAKAMGFVHLGTALEGLLDLNGAEAAYEEGLGLLEGGGNPRIRTALTHSIAILAMERGDFESARQIMRSCLRLIEATGSRAGIAGALETLATAELACGDLTAAETGFRRSISMFEEIFNNLQQINCLGGFSRLATATGDHARAIRLAAVVEHHSQMWGYRDPPFWRELLRASTEESRARLGAVKAESAWKEGWAMQFTRGRDYALEQRMPAADPGPLSGREIDIARLIAQGKTNREIGEQLFISERTVEGHVDRIRNKLALRSRTMIATWVVEHGLQVTREGS